MFKVGDKVRVNKYKVDSPMSGAVSWVDGMDSYQGQIHVIGYVYEDYSPVRYIFEDKKYYFVEDWLEPVDEISITHMEQLEGVENGHGLKLRVKKIGGVDIVDPNGHSIKRFIFWNASTAVALSWYGFKVKFSLDREKIEKEVMGKFNGIPWVPEQANWYILHWGDGEYGTCSSASRMPGITYYTEEDAGKIATELNTLLKGGEAEC